MEANEVKKAAEAVNKEEVKVETKTDVTPWKEETKVVETTKEPELTPEEKLKKREAEMTKGVKKVQDELKTEKEIRVQKEKDAQLYRDIITEGKKIASDEWLLVDLYYEKPEVAQWILNEYYWGITFDEFVKSKELNDNTPARIEALAKQKAEEYISKSKVQSHIESFKKDMWYNEDTMKKFDEELEDMLGDKINSMDADKLERYLVKIHKMAILDEDELKASEKTEKIAKKMWVSEWWSNGGWKEEEVDPRLAKLREFRKNNW